MAIQTTMAGRNSEYHGKLVIRSTQSGSVVHLPVKTGVFPDIDHNNILAPAVVEFKHAVRRPAVVYKQIRIGVPRSLLKSLKILGKSKRIGVTETRVVI